MRDVGSTGHAGAAGPAPGLLTPADTALLETLILQAPVAFAFYGPDMRYRRINRMLADINGLPMASHLGRRPSELLGELGVKVEARLREVFRTAVSSPTTTSARRPRPRASSGTTSRSGSRPGPRAR